MDNPSLHLLERIDLAGKQCPERLAVVDQERALSFAQLIEASHQLAGELARRGVVKGDLVCLFGQRSAEFVVAVLALWRLGAAYVPVAPDTPPLRLTQILALAECRAVVTLGNTACPVPHQLCLRCAPDQPWPSARIESRPDQNDLAYVIFTSGSTGVPKGVMVGHESLGPMMAAFADHFGIRAGDRVSAVATIAFDASVIEFWPALSRAATVYVADQQTVLSPHQLLEWMARHALTFSWLPTPLVEVIIKTPALTVPASLRVIETAGQRLTVRPRGWSVPLENSYGPTETTVIATSARVTPDGDGAPDIGRALPGVTIHVLGPDLRAVPEGEIGQIYIGGIGVTRGYLKQAELTAEKFIADPFASEPGRRLYASGDLGRQMPDGRLEFIGRIDDGQIKLRGHRIEPGEIEYALGTIDGITQAVCLLSEVAETAQLVAYYTMQAGHQANPESLREILTQRLPAWMVPAHLIALSVFPLTPNGKIDRAALPAPVMASRADDTLLAPAQQAFLDWMRTVSGLPLDWESDFFQSGGSSIDAIVLLEALRQSRGSHPGFAAFFAVSTPAGLYALLQENRPNQALPRITPGTGQRPYRAPLSVSQRSIWFLDHLNPADRAYHARAHLVFRGHISAASLQAALQDVVDRHDILRTTFIADSDEVYQVIHPHHQVDLMQFDLSSVSPHPINDTLDALDALDALLRNELAAPFALDCLPLVRWALVRLPDNGSALLHVEHHILHDGWSFNLFLRDLFDCYRARHSGAAPTLPRPATLPQYADFCQAQQVWLASPAARQDEAYWRAQLQGAPSRTNLPTNGENGDSDGQTIRIRFERARWAQIEALCRRHRYTPFAFLLAALQQLLSRVAQEDDVCIGSAFSNRSWEGTETILGMLINTVVLRLQSQPDDTVHDLLQRALQVCVEAQSHEAMPFETLVQSINPVREPGENPFFQVFLGLHNSPSVALTLPGVDHIELTEALDTGAAKFDLSLIVLPRQNDSDSPAHFLWEFKRNRLAPWFMENLIAGFDRIVTAFLQHPEGLLCDVVLAAPGQSEHQSPVTEVNSMCDRIASVAARQPQSTAIRFRETQLSYGELLALIEQRARHLQRCGVGPGDLIGVCLPRTPDLIAWLVAIQHAGAAYIPLDPAYPSARLAYIVEHSRPRFVVGDADCQSFVAPNLRLPDDADHAAPNAHACPADLPVLTPGLPAYVIYTSGSTGVPKGVVVDHGNLDFFLNALTALFPMDRQARWAAVTSMSFDISILECFLPLSQGATLVLAGEDQARDAGRLATLLASERISHFQATPSTWRALLDTGWQPEAEFIGLCGGEALDANLANECLQRGVRLYNMYGPTETTIWSCWFALSGPMQSVPIGQPIGATEVFILDRQRRLLPPGAIGELWIGGPGVSQGYLHAPELTAQRFIAHPFGGIGQLYATGDLVSLDSDGNLRFHGRNDSQVKVRGFRIEIGEIERVIGNCGSVAGVAVALRNIHDTPTLVAWIVAHGQPDLEAVQQQCAQQLPGYMLPTLWMSLPALPLTPNGKLDRAALPTPGPATTTREPQTETERILLDCYSTLFGNTPINVGTGFYALGGHSLLAMRLVALINRRFHIELSVTDFLRLATIEAIARQIDIILQARPAVVEEFTL